MDQEPKLVTVARAAEMLGVAQVTVYRMIERGDLKEFPVEGKVAVLRREDIEALLAERERTPAGGAS